MSRIWVPEDTNEKRKMLQDLFSNPHLLPPSLLSFLNDYNALNPAFIPASQIIGISGFLERLDSNADTVTIVSDTSEVTIYSYDVPAGLLQTKGAIKTEIQGKWLQNQATAAGNILRVKYGATTMYERNVSNLVANSIDLIYWTLSMVLSNRGATNDQQLIGWLLASQKDVTTGDGWWWADAVTGGVFQGGFGGTAAEDSTLKKTFTVTMQTDVSHANNRIDKLVAHTTRIAQ